MKVKDLLNLYKQELSSLYNLSEIEAVFYRLTAFYWHIDRLSVSLNPGMEIVDEQLHKILPQLQQQKPWQYITGQTEFMDLTFSVNPSVLIPRPETEELVSWILSDYKDYKNKLSVLDIGTGSGAIAVSLAKHLPQAQVTAFDISAKALKTAQKNAKQNNVNVDFQRVDILKTTQLTADFELIVSNPPYVKDAEKKWMKGNVLQYEPELALFVPDDNPLLFYRKIIELAYKNNKQTTLYFEINEALKPELETLLISKKLTNYTFKKDIFNKWRMLKVKLLPQR